MADVNALWESEQGITNGPTLATTRQDWADRIIWGRYARSISTRPRRTSDAPARVAGAAHEFKDSIALLTALCQESFAAGQHITSVPPGPRGSNVNAIRSRARASDRPTARRRG